MIGKIRRLSKEKKVKLTIVSFAAIMVTIVFGIVYATLTNTLTITGTADVRDSKWKLRFDNLQEKEKSETAEEITAPQIVDDSHIGDYSISLTTPGDYVSYTFDIVNEGDYDAAIGDTFSMPTPECHGIGDNALTDCENVLQNLEYTIKYEDGTNVQVDDIIESYSTVSIKVKLLYKDNIDPSELPQDDVEITNLGITIPFVQPDDDKSAKVNEDGTTPYVEPTYDIGQEVAILNEKYNVIGVGDDYVTLLKQVPLTYEEMTQNNYGQGYINRYTYGSVGQVYNNKGYGALAYYSSPTCGYATPGGLLDVSGCESEGATNYNNSDIKHVIDDWAVSKFTNGELKTVDGYGTRLATKEELQPIGWPSCSSTATYCSKETDTPNWLYNRNYWYWTMSQANNSASGLWDVGYDGDLNVSSVLGTSGSVRPVLNIYKSKI